jgi:hypothetical protein
MQNQDPCGCSGAYKPTSYSLRLLIDMLEKAEARKKEAESVVRVDTGPDLGVRSDGRKA